MEEKKINNISSVCVYCASSTKIPPIYFDAAKELGCLLGERKLRVVNGAGNIGLMCTVSDAALAAGGTVTGVIPHFMVEQDWYHKPVSPEMLSSIITVPCSSVIVMVRFSSAFIKSTLKMFPCMDNEGGRGLIER